MEHFSWDQRNTDKLIEQWSAMPCLYDPSCADYRDKGKREIAVSQIAAELGALESDIRDKMKTLRSQYSRERLHEEKSLADASKLPGRTPYKSKWMYFVRLSFLEECKRKSRRSDDPALEEGSDQGNRLTSAVDRIAHDRQQQSPTCLSEKLPVLLAAHQSRDRLDAFIAASQPVADDDDPDDDEDADTELIIDTEPPPPLPRHSRLHPGSLTAGGAATRPSRDLARRVDGRTAADEEPAWTSIDWHSRSRPSRPSARVLESRSRYGSGGATVRPRPPRVVLPSLGVTSRRRREPGVWPAGRASASASSPAARSTSIVAATAVEELSQQPPFARSHKAYAAAAHASGVPASPATSLPCLNGRGDGAVNGSSSFDVDTVLRAVAAGAASATAAAVRRSEPEDAEAAFGQFIAKQLRQLPGGRERQLAKLRIHQAMVETLTTVDDSLLLGSAGGATSGSCAT